MAPQSSDDVRLTDSVKELVGQEPCGIAEDYEGRNLLSNPTFRGGFDMEGAYRIHYNVGKGLCHHHSVMNQLILKDYCFTEPEVK